MLNPRLRECTCGSGIIADELYDARGIYCCMICDDCEDERRAKYRAEIFDDPDYDSYEPIEPYDC